MCAYEHPHNRLLICTHGLSVHLMQLCLCTAAFREAVSRLPKSGGVLYVPPGTYRLREAVHIADQPITIRGEGIGVSILAWTEDAGSTGLLITQERPACNCIGGPWPAGKRQLTNTEHPWQGKQPKTCTASLPPLFLGTSLLVMAKWNLHVMFLQV